jgi:hypothetical protein
MFASTLIRKTFVQVERQLSKPKKIYFIKLLNFLNILNSFQCPGQEL